VVRPPIRRGFYQMAKKKKKVGNGNPYRDKRKQKQESREDD
jgi:hypothetical protein